MLKGIPSVIGPELLKILNEMGHGDEIVIGDGNFPAHTYGKRVVRADGVNATEMLKAVLKLIPLDTFDHNFILMDAPKESIPEIWSEYFSIAKKEDKNLDVAFVERFSFYERAKNAYAVITTSETAIYANIIIKKGVI